MYAKQEGFEMAEVEVSLVKESTLLVIDFLERSCLLIDLFAFDMG